MLPRVHITMSIINGTPTFLSFIALITLAKAEMKFLINLRVCCDGDRDEDDDADAADDGDDDDGDDDGVQRICRWFVFLVLLTSCWRWWFCC